MGVASELGYRHRPANRFRRLMRAFASTRFGAWTFSRSLAPSDRLVRRLSQGRASVPELLAGLPVLFLTTTGRRSGRPRTSPLIAVPVDDDLAVLGTNFGQAPTPAWVLNLEADPTAHLAFQGAEVDAVARPATDAERERIWADATDVYAGYAAYRRRIAGREVRIFVLERAPA